MHGKTYYRRVRDGAVSNESFRQIHMLCYQSFKAFHELCSSPLDQLTPRGLHPVLLIDA